MSEMDDEQTIKIPSGINDDWRFRQATTETEIMAKQNTYCAGQALDYAAFQTMPRPAVAPLHSTPTRHCQDSKALRGRGFIQYRMPPSPAIVDTRTCCSPSAVSIYLLFRTYFTGL